MSSRSKPMIAKTPPTEGTPTQSTTPHQPPPELEEDDILAPAANATPPGATTLDPAMVGSSVHFYQDPTGVPWAAIITRVKADGVVDLAVFRPDGHNLRYYDIPRRHPRLTLGAWDMMG